MAATYIVVRLLLTDCTENTLLEKTTCNFASIASQMRCERSHSHFSWFLWPANKKKVLAIPRTHAQTIDNYTNFLGNFGSTLNRPRAIVIHSVGRGKAILNIECLPYSRVWHFNQRNIGFPGFPQESLLSLQPHADCRRAMQTPQAHDRKWLSTHKDLAARAIFSR